MVEEKCVDRVFILSGVRTAIGSFNGCFEKTPAKTLGATVIREAIRRAQIEKDEVDEVVMGQVLTAGQGQNAAMQSAVEAGLRVPATTVNMMCGSGLKTVELGYLGIRCKQANVMVCGGQENMSRALHVAHIRNTKLGSTDLKDSILCDGLTDAFTNLLMGETVEYLAQKYQISRERQDKSALQSQKRAEAAIKSGHFEKEIVPVQSEKTGEFVLLDEHPRFNITLEKLASLKPCFVKPDGMGTVTAGNASGINDGAAAVVLCSGRFLEARKLTARAEIVGFEKATGEPIEMGLMPVLAVQKLLKNIGWFIEEVDLYELNEAYAAQAELVVEQLGVPHEKVNINGGGIALGHPLGASGTRILVTLLHSLERLQLKKGVAALCVGGGMGIAIAIQIC